MLRRRNQRLPSPRAGSTPAESVADLSYKMKVMSERVKTAERIIQDLSPEELLEFASWFSDFHSQMWDVEIERDSEAGRLDKLIADAHKAFEAGLAPNGKTQCPSKS